MPKTLRSGRLNEEIMREVSEIVKNGMKDPRISQMTSVLRAEVTRDLSFAKVYVSVYGDEAARKDTLEALVAARGYIRSELAKRLSLRRVPALIFVMDDSIEYALSLIHISVTLMLEEGGTLLLQQKDIARIRPYIRF